MPLYEYEHPNTKERKVLVQKMNDVHEHTDEHGIKWNRIFEAPNARIDGEIDPFSENAFKEKTKNFNGTIGDLYDMSQELSEKRASKRGGIDPIKDKTVKDYEKRTQKKHPNTVKKKDKIVI
jgi:hypothetical protein